MSDSFRASASGTGLSQVEPASAVSPVPASIPDAAPRRSLWLDQRRKQFRGEFYNGPVILDFPNVLKPDEIDDLDRYLALVIAGLRRTAQGIETRRAETLGSVEDESAVATPCAQPSAE